LYLQTTVDKVPFRRQRSPVNPDGDEGNSLVSRQPTVTRERDGERGRRRGFAESDGDPRCPDSDEGEGERRRERETARLWRESETARLWRGRETREKRREGEGERELT
jgi:hypothetical protein